MGLSMRKLASLLCTGLVTLALAGTARADKLKIERSDAKGPPVMTFYATFIDNEGRAITQKTKDDFKLTVDSADVGVATAMIPFAETQEPLNLIVVVQITSAMSEVIDEAKRGARELATIAGPKSKVGIYAYASDTKRIFELGAPTEAESAANNLTIDNEASEPHLLDAVRAAIETLSNSTMKDQRKLVVVFSDGIDVNNERKAFSAIGKKAQEANVIIDTIGFAPFEAAKLKGLEEFSKQSNGTFRMVKAGAEVTTTFGMVTDEIKKQYVLSYVVPETICGDNKSHTFQLVYDAAGGKGAYSNTYEGKIGPKTQNVKTPENPNAPKSRWWLWVLIGVAAFVLLAGIAAVAMREKPEPAPAPVMAAPVAAPAAQKQRTMALNVADLGGGKAAAVGWIVGMTGSTADKTFKLKSGRNVVGTAEDCDIKLSEPGVSGHHCEIRTEGGIYKLLDLGSTNGVIVNDKKVREHELVDNDVFRVGKAEFKFKTLA